MSTGVFWVPVTTFVVGFVVWNDRVAGTVLSRPMPHDVAVKLAGLMMVANAVAVVPTTTDRLDGSTDATTAGGAQAVGVNAKSKTPVPLVAACTHAPDGAIASALTSRFPRPALKSPQLSPPLIVLKTPPPIVLA